MATAVEVFKGRQATLRGLIKGAKYCNDQIMYGFSRDDETCDQIDRLRDHKKPILFKRHKKKDVKGKSVEPQDRVPMGPPAKRARLE